MPYSNEFKEEVPMKKFFTMLLAIALLIGTCSAMSEGLEVEYGTEQAQEPTIIGPVEEEAAELGEIELSALTDVETDGAQPEEDANASTVGINASNFPDDNFRAYISQNCDRDHNNKLSDAEIKAVTSLYVSSKSITSLKGVEYFTNLEQLWCGYNPLVSLDLKKNTQLTKLSCSNCSLKNLDVSKNTKLTSLECSTNELKQLKVGKNKELQVLSCAINQLTTLDVSKNKKLQQLICDSNSLTKLDVSKNTELFNLGCDNNKLTKLDLKKNAKLEQLYVTYNQLTTLELNKNTALYSINCGFNKLKKLDLRKNVNLKYLTCENNALTGIDLSKNKELMQLRIDNNQVKQLDVSKCKKLTDLSFTYNPITLAKVAVGTVMMTGMPSSSFVSTSPSVVGPTSEGRGLIAKKKGSTTIIYDQGEEDEWTFKVNVL